MKFYDREREFAFLQEIRRKSEATARFTVITGRRRVGKTQLVKHAMEDQPYLYFYVGRKSEKIEAFLQKNPSQRDLQISVKGLSLSDM